MVGYPKFDQNRGSVGHARAPITQQGTLRTGSMKNADLQPAPANSADQVPSENGFVADVVVANPHDAQSVQTTAPPINRGTEGPSQPATTTTPPKGAESDPTPGASDPGATGGAVKPGYPAQIGTRHPAGYPSN